MKGIKSSLLCMLCMTAMLQVKAQLYVDTSNNIELVSSGDSIREGIAAHDTGNYTRAIELFSRVPEGDTNYTLALYESALTQINDSSYKLAISTIEYSLQYPDINKEDFMMLKASALDYLKEKDSAIMIYKKMIKAQSNNYRASYELALVFYRDKEFDSAAYYLEKTLLMNAGYFKAHQLLGLTYVSQGRLTEAAISLQSALLYAPNSSSAGQIIGFLDGLMRQNDFYSDAYIGKKEQYRNEAYEEMDALLHAKIILNENYKIKSLLNNELQAKLTYAIMEKVSFDPENDNFVMQFYMPLWNSIKEKNQTDQFLIFLYSGYGFESIEKLYKKEKKEVDQLRQDAYTYMNNITATRSLNLKAREKAKHYYIADNSNGYYYEAVLNDKNELDEGSANIYLYGNLYGKGKFNHSGKKEGLWTYYFKNGEKKSEETYSNGEPAGEHKEWYESGLLASITGYDKAHIASQYKTFNHYGLPKETFELVDEKNKRIHKISYYENGQKSSDVIMKDGEYEDGKYETYYQNGQVYNRFSIKNGKRNGEAKEYFENGTLKESYNYVNGKLEGSYEAYYESGKLSTKTNYKDGKYEGLYESWDEDAKQDMKQNYKDGKLNGRKYYYHQGESYGFVDFENDIPKASEFKKPDGSLITQNEKEPTHFKVYYANGNLKMDAPLKNGKMEGWVQFYNYGGMLEQEEEFKEDRNAGIVKKYHPFGGISLSYPIKDGDANGLYTSYYINGKPNSRGHYLNGNLQGKWCYYHINGQPSRTNYYNNGELDGYDAEYNIKGELRDKDFYYQDILYRCVQVDSQGKIFRDDRFEKGNGTYALYTAGVKYPRFECNLANGRFEGDFSRKYPDGSISEKGHFHFGKRTGSIEGYSIFGHKTLSGAYNEKGNKEGTWTYYHQVSGEKTIEQNFKDNVEEGKKIYYTPYSRYEYQYKKGIRDGAQQVYFEDKLALVLYYEDGNLIGYSYQDSNKKLLAMIPVLNRKGDINSFYPNGKKATVLHYENNLMEGHQEYYYDNGQIAEERNYKNSDYNGPYKEYFPNGKTRVDAVYLDDELQGLYREFDENGDVIRSLPYYYGTIHGTAVYKDSPKNKTKKVVYRYDTAIAVE